MFLDESGEAKMSFDPRFDIFVLCGVLFKEDDYKSFCTEFNQLKKNIFNRTDVVFHSFEMRKQLNEFKIFRDKSILNKFYQGIEDIFTKQNYTIIACVINKSQYRDKYPYKDQAYEEALMFLCERSISFVGRKTKGNSIHFCLEKRGKGKDRYLKKFYTSFRKYGTEYYSTEEFKMCHPDLHFRGKNDLVPGLEFADLCAFPIAIKNLHPERPQPTFELIRKKFYRSIFGKVNGIGLKIFP